jgi:translation initiation factor 2B subunit (eIF-2B alpha/beta/delta family)
MKGCSELITIDLSKLTNLTNIQNNFMEGCTKLTTINLSNLTYLTYIGSDFLKGCNQSITITCSKKIKEVLKTNNKKLSSLITYTLV